MSDLLHPAVASVTIRRLTLPPGETGRGLGEAVAAALRRELAGDDPARAADCGVAEAIARGIARHPRLAALGAGAGGTSDGPR